MLRFLKQWFQNRTTKALKKSTHSQPLTYTFAPEQLHLHWHITDSNQTASEVTWNSALLATANSVSVRPPSAFTYDETLFEKAKTQWQFGDWDSLMALDEETLKHHPDRAKLALLAASGHMQTGDTQIARQFTRLAQDWGCSKKLISQILIAGVHNSLGRAATINGETARALQHFESAITTGSPTSEQRLLANARLTEQVKQLGLVQDSLKHLLAQPNH